MIIRLLGPGVMMDKKENKATACRLFTIALRNKGTLTLKIFVFSVQIQDN